MDLTPVEEAAAVWGKAKRALRSARSLLDEDDIEGAVNRAYYAAFDAVTALLILDGRKFKRHSAVNASVHRDLIRTGRWPKELGEDYSELLERREDADYGAFPDISAET